MMNVVLSYELPFCGAIRYSIALDDLPVLTLFRGLDHLEVGSDFVLEHLGVHNVELLGVGLGNAVSTCEELYVVSIGLRKDSVGACVPLRVRRERSFLQSTQGTR